MEGCKTHPAEIADTNNAVFKTPLTVPLNIQNGYIINLLTGDSINPLVNSSGSPVSTGKPILFKKEAVPFSDVYKTTLLQTKREVKKINKYEFPVTASIIKSPVNESIGYTDRDKTVSKDTLITATGTEIKLHAIIRKYHEPYPSKSLPMRFKEDGSGNIQFLDVEQGLGFSYINALIVDKKGDLWFGTDGFGLSKYNGTGFTNYTTKDGLVSNTIFSILQDRSGNIWIGTQNGISVFDGDRFIQFTDKEWFNGNTVLCLSEDSNGNIWAGSEHGLFKITFNPENIQSAKCLVYTTKDGLPANEVGAFLEEANGRIWLGTTKGIAVYEKNKIKPIRMNSNSARLSFTAITKDKQENIWFGTNEGLIKFDGVNYFSYPIITDAPVKLISSLVVDTQGNLWIGTKFNGLIKFNGQKFISYGQPQGLTNRRINKITEDAQQNIWCSIDGKGIIKINSNGFDYPIDQSYFDFSRVRPVRKDNEGNLWFGTEEGNIYQYKTDHIDKYSFIEPSDIIYGIRSMLPDKSGNLWFGRTDGGGVVKYDGSQFIEISDKKKGLPLNIMSLDLLENGDIGIGSFGNGVNIISGDKENFEKSSIIRFSEKEGLSNNKIFKIFTDKKNQLWFGTDGGGLCRFDGTYLTNYSEREGLFVKSITSLEEDNDHNIWIGSNGSGVCRFDGKSFTYFTEQQGLSNNNVWSVAIDTAGQLWVGTDKGLSLIKIKKTNSVTDEYSIFNYGTQNGLKAMDFNLHSVCIDNDNRIWWGTGKGVPSLDLRKNLSKYLPYSLRINQIEINEKYHDFRNLDNDIKNSISFSGLYSFQDLPKDLSLSFDQNHLRFHFSCIDWSAPEKIKYSYRLLGSDENWRNATEETFADYRNLKPGKYQFEIKAMGESQIWTPTVNYAFNILPAWWQTWLFKFMITLLFLSLLFMAVRFVYLYHLNRQRTAMEKQLAVQIERQRISSEMHDDIGAGLSGVRLLTEFTKSKHKSGDITNELDKIYQSIGDISAKMREAIWSLNTENDSLHSLIHYLQKQARLILEHYPGELSVTIPENIPDIKIIGQTRRNIYLSVKEALHNIIKHSGADKIDMKILCDNQLRIIISDNGKGMNLNQNMNTGNGIKNIEKRMKLMNAHLTFENNKGLTLIFSFPLK